MPNVVSHLKFAVAVILLSQVALACIMTPRPPTKIRGTRIEGRFTYEGKPLSRSKVELRTASGRLLRTTTTDKNGGYRLAVAASDLYQIRLLNPSVEGFQVDYVASTTAHEKFEVNFYGDYCYNIAVTSENPQTSGA